MQVGRGGAAGHSLWHVVHWYLKNKSSIFTRLHCFDFEREQPHTHYELAAAQTASLWTRGLVVAGTARPTESETALGATS